MILTYICNYIKCRQVVAGLKTEMSLVCDLLASCAAKLGNLQKNQILTLSFVMSICAHIKCGINCLGFCSGLVEVTHQKTNQLWNYFYRNTNHH